MAERRPNRALGGVHDAFWNFTSLNELRIQKCADCGHYEWPPQEACESCGSKNLDWNQVSGRGKVVSWCTFERPYYKVLPVPWDTILVELEEGPLFISDPKGFANSEITSDMPVRAAFIECEDDAGEFRLPVFERA